MSFVLGIHNRHLTRRASVRTSTFKSSRPPNNKQSEPNETLWTTEKPDKWDQGLIMTHLEHVWRPWTISTGLIKRGRERVCICLVLERESGAEKKR